MGAIRSAYQTSDPWLYYPLDDGTLTDIGSNSHAAALSGDTDLTALGVEKGFTALHMGSTGAITSDVLGLNTASDFSMACYGMMAPIAAWNSFRDLMTIGLRGGTIGTNRGGSLGLNGVSGGQPNPVGGAWPSTVFASGPAVSQPYNFWHHYAMVYNQTTRLVTCYTDGVAAAGTTMNAAMGAFGPSDRLIFAWTSGQFVVAHVAFWRFQLTSTTVGNIGGFASNWPPNQAIQVGGSSGGGGGGGTVTIGEPQATQITNIETHTNDIPGLVDAANFISDTVNHIKGVTDQVLTDTTNMIGTLFPQLADELNNLGAQLNDVQNAVRGTIQDGSSSIVQTVGEILSNHNIDILEHVSITGGETCSPVSEDLTGRRVYGIIVTITRYPDSVLWRTPDHAWTLKDLAVIRIYHHGQLMVRHGVHTISHTMEPIPQRQLPWIGPFIPLQAEGTTLTVDWADGVCGDVTVSQKSS